MPPLLFPEFTKKISFFIYILFALSFRIGDLNFNIMFTSPGNYEKYPETLWGLSAFPGKSTLTCIFSCI